MPHWCKIVVCDPRDKRGVAHTYEQIRSFHRSFKDLKSGELLTEEIAEQRLASGQPGVSRPWKHAGFHWAVARGRSGEPEIIMLRPMTQNGAYAREHNFNRSAIGILCEEYSEPFLEKLLDLCRFLMKTYKITPENVIGRWEYTAAKPKPEGFDIEQFRQRIQISLLEGILHNVPSPEA